MNALHVKVFLLVQDLAQVALGVLRLQGLEAIAHVHQQRAVGPYVEPTSMVFVFT